jgi:hypothetical protein
MEKEVSMSDPNSNTTNGNTDRQNRLYNLLPVIYRLRDAEQGEPLRALLQVIAEQVNIVEDDIAQLYANWFIETSQDWVTPYLGDLIGYRPVHDAGEPGDVSSAEGQQRNKVLVPRRDVANTIRDRRRKGTLALLESLSHDVAGWPALAVEFYTRLAWNQHLNHLHLKRGGSVDIRKQDRLMQIGGPWDHAAHSVDVRLMQSPHGGGRYNIMNVGLFVWRLRSYSVTRTPAYCLESVGPQCYTFSVLGTDTPLFVHPQPEAHPAQRHEALDLPAPIRRWEFEQHKADYYGEKKSCAIWAEWAGYDMKQPIPLSAIITADLSDWVHCPPRGFIAVDPETGRIAFPPSQLPKKVRVYYHYGFSADIGGGEYDRMLSQPAQYTLYRIGEAETYKRINDALVQWRKDKPRHAVLEITDSNVYVEQLGYDPAAQQAGITLDVDQSLQLRAANHARPVIRLLDWQTDLTDALTVYMSVGSRLTLDGLLISGRSVMIRAAPTDTTGDTPSEKANGTTAKDELCAAEVCIRHCTLVPGWALECDCEPKRPAEPSLELFNVRARLCIEHSIIGSIQVNEDRTRLDPIPVQISDSVIDATNDEREALGAPGCPVAHVRLTIRRATVFGKVQVHAIDLAENSIFTGLITVAHRQMGCMRFCSYVKGSRTPRRYECQPDLAELAVTPEALRGVSPLPPAVEEARARARLRVRPQFNSVRYGRPDYCQLAETCAEEITRGADDESEMGVFHDLFQPQRMANLRARLSEYTPASADTRIFLVN